MFIKHGDAQPIRHVIDAPEVIDESAKEALERAKKAAQDEKLVGKIPSADTKA